MHVVESPTKPTEGEIQSILDRVADHITWAFMDFDLGSGMTSKIHTRSPQAFCMLHVGMFLSIFHEERDSKVREMAEGETHLDTEKSQDMHYAAITVSHSLIHDARIA